MFVCPICNQEFNTDIDVAKHSLQCWREHHPNHQSKDAPRSEDITTYNINNDILDFFERLNDAGSKS